MVWEQVHDVVTRGALDGCEPALLRSQRSAASGGSAARSEVVIDLRREWDATPAFGLTSELDRRGRARWLLAR